MIKPFIIFTIFISLTICSYPQQVKVKSLRAYNSGGETYFPVISIPNGKLTIEFDVASKKVPDMNIVFRFCDKNWKPTGNTFFLNTGKDVFYYLHFKGLPVSVKEAHYHFSGTFPDEKQQVSFPYSGKWRFFITDSQDTSLVYATGRFYVVSQDVALNVTLKNEQLEDKTYFPKDLAKVFNITTKFTIPDELFPSYVDHVEIIENRKIDYPIIIDKSFNTNTRHYYWDANRKFSFTARDIRPGNEYRQTDLRDINKFNSKNVRAQFEGMEYSRFFLEGAKDLNGASILTEFNDDFATYMNVSFSIRPPEEFYGNIFLVGAFNDWQLSPTYQMNSTGGVYKETVTMKRGKYDYQFVAADNYNGEIANADWYILEGNSWETSNEYNIFLFYKDPNFGGYDRIIGHVKLITP